MERGPMDVMMEAVQVPAPLGEAEHHRLRKPSADCDTAIDLFGNGFGIARCLAHDDFFVIRDVPGAPDKQW